MQLQGVPSGVVLWESGRGGRGVGDVCGRDGREREWLHAFHARSESGARRAKVRHGEREWDTKREWGQGVRVVLGTITMD